jgi:excisionase family DNA binding protein
MVARAAKETHSTDPRPSWVLTVEELDERMEAALERALARVAAKGAANAPAPDWLNTAQAAKLVGLTARTLNNYVNDGKIPHYRDGKEPARFRRDELEAWLASRKR